MKVVNNMKKIPTLFKKIYDDNGKMIGISNEVTEGMEWVLKGEGIATIKYDGSCCAVINGEFYKRYDAKKGKKVPEGAIKCQEEPDKITGHFPHWVKINENNPSDKWFIEAFKNYKKINENIEDGTYEAIGRHFNSNPYNLFYDTLIPHGKDIVKVERTFEGIRNYLEKYSYKEGLVFWKDGEPRCKIRRIDFGFYWNNTIKVIKIKYK